MRGPSSPIPQECEQLRAGSGDSALKFCPYHKDRTWVKETLYEQEKIKKEIFLKELVTYRWRLDNYF